jgi:hypothetical protein
LVRLTPPGLLENRLALAPLEGRFVEGDTRSASARRNGELVFERVEAVATAAA